MPSTYKQQTKSLSQKSQLEKCEKVHRVVYLNFKDNTRLVLVLYFSVIKYHLKSNTQGPMNRCIATTAKFSVCTQKPQHHHRAQMHYKFHFPFILLIMKLNKSYTFGLWNHFIYKQSILIRYLTPIKLLFHSIYL